MRGALTLSMMLSMRIALAAEAPTDYAAAIAAEGRPADMVAFDGSWKPAEILDFFELKSGMTALDIIADGGYYSEIMARTVGPKGRVVALVYDEKAEKGFAGLHARNPNIEFTASPCIRSRRNP